MFDWLWQWFHPRRRHWREECWQRSHHGWHHHHHHHHPHPHRKAKHLNLMLFTIDREGGVLMAATPVTVTVGKSVLFSIAPTDASGADASADVPAAGVAFSLTSPIGALTLNPDGYSGTIVTTTVGTATLNVSAALNSGGSLTDSGDITATAVVSPATALNLKVVAA